MAANDALASWLSARNSELEREVGRLRGAVEAASALADECERRARTVSDAAGDREIRGSDLGRMHAYFRVAGEIREALG